MVTLTALWLPIVVSAVGVFFASTLIHMVFQWHKADYRKLGNEDEVAAAIRKSPTTPGQYVMPHCLGPKEMQTPEAQKKFADGPVAFLIVRPNGMPRMGPTLGQWFLLTLAVAAIAGDLAAVSLPAATDASHVFHLVGSITFLTYAGGSMVNGIWMGRMWSAVTRDLLDALIYGAISGAAFAWLWPH